MLIPYKRVTSPSWPRLPRRTARLRLAVLYGGLFLLCGAVLLALTYLLVRRVTGEGRGVVAAGGPAGLGIRASMAQLGQMSKLPGMIQMVKLPGTDQWVQIQGVVQSANQGAIRQSAFDMEQLLIQSGIALGIVAVAAVVLGWLVAGRVLRPLATITATARQISASSLHERLSLPGPDDELKELGDTLDALFARLEAAFEAQRNFVANASHELRTPVTRERALLQVTLADPAATSGTWQAVSRELLASNTEQERIIEALLALASSEGGLDQREPVDLAEAAGHVLAAPRPGIARLGLHVEAGIRPAVIDGDPVLAERLVANLIDNAVRHNVRGGEVWIATGTSDGCAVLSVTNTGPVIPPAEVDRLFEPFQRLHQRRSGRKDGHGLGLSIVRAIARAHGAAITARAAPGGGLAVEVTFPPAGSSVAPGSQPRGRRSRGGRPGAGRGAPESRGDRPLLTAGAGGPA